MANIKDFPRMVGETADDGRIQRAIEDAEWRGDRLLYFPRQEQPYAVSERILLPEHFIVRGDGAVIQQGTPNWPLFTNYWYPDYTRARPTDGIAIIGLHLKGTPPASCPRGTAFAGLIDFALVSNLRIEDTEIEGEPLYGVSIRDVDGFAIKNCYIHDFVRAGIMAQAGPVKSGCFNGLISGNRICHATMRDPNENTYGIALGGDQGNRIKTNLARTP